MFEQHLEKLLNYIKSRKTTREPRGCLANHGEKAIQGLWHQCTVAHWTPFSQSLLVKKLGRLSGYLHSIQIRGPTSIWIVYRGGVYCMDKLDLVHLKQAFTGQFQTWNWKTAGLLTASINSSAHKRLWREWHYRKANMISSPAKCMHGFCKSKTYQNHTTVLQLKPAYRNLSIWELSCWTDCISGLNTG